MANCNGCGSQWDNKQTAPVCGSQEDNKRTPPVCSFAANRFSLYDMVGNVWEWTEDCANPSYKGAPADGFAWTSGDCSSRVVRGGSWVFSPENLRSAYRNWAFTVNRDDYLGFRVARTLTP